MLVRHSCTRDSGSGWLQTGADLFGNHTPHADGDFEKKLLKKPVDPNGFIALTYYDQKEAGGDMNLILDKNDAIWPHLRVWIPTHCWDHPEQACTSFESELHALDDLGIHSLSLLWEMSNKTAPFDST